jgi:phosphoribosylformylglycinamidine (FGAM) synthase-like enzyme
VKAVGIEFCPSLGIAIPVGKDSLSMRTKWDDSGEAKQVIAPLSLIVTAFAAVDDVRRTLTPQLRPDAEVGETELLLIDLGHGTQSARWVGAGAGVRRQRRPGAGCGCGPLKAFFARYRP